MRERGFRALVRVEDMTEVLQVVLNGVMLSLIYILIALGLSLVFGVMHIINFAHGEIYMLGSYVVYYLFARAGINYFLAVLAAMAATALLGIIIERGFFRPLRGKLMQSVMVAIGMSITIQEFSRIGFGIDDKFIPSVFQGTFALLGATLTTERLMVMLVSTVLMVLLYLFVSRSKTGRAMRAVAQDSEAAALQGISLATTSCTCMAIGCALAAAAGGLLSPVFYIHPYMGGEVILKAFIIITIGGIGSLAGAVMGGFVLGFTDSVGTFLLGGETSLLIGFVMLMVILLVRPQGLLGHA